MAVESGRFARVLLGGLPIKECTRWEITKGRDILKYASCQTNGTKKNLVGNLDVTGRIEGVLDPDDAPDDPTGSAPLPIIAGTKVTIQLFINSIVYHEIDVYLGSFDNKNERESAEVSRWTCEWAMNDDSPQFYLRLA